MPGDLLLYLEDIRDAAASIRSYVGDRAFEEFVDLRDPPLWNLRAAKCVGRSGSVARNEETPASDVLVEFREEDRASSTPDRT